MGPKCSVCTIFVPDLQVRALVPIASTRAKPAPSTSTSRVCSACTHFPAFFIFSSPHNTRAPLLSTLFAFSAKTHSTNLTLHPLSLTDSSPASFPWQQQLPTLERTKKQERDQISKKQKKKIEEENVEDEGIQRRQRVHVAEPGAAGGIRRAPRRAQGQRRASAPLLRPFPQWHQRLPRHFLQQTRNPSLRLFFLQFSNSLYFCVFNFYLLQEKFEDLKAKGCKLLGICWKFNVPFLCCPLQRWF